jgi:nitrite reductase (NADH) small subunit
MSELVKIGTKKDLPKPGDVKELTANGRPLCVANLNGVIHALDNECPHHGGPLGEGMLEGNKVVCPWHAWSFDVVTGKSAEEDERVRVFPVTTQGDEVFVEI